MNYFLPPFSLTCYEEMKSCMERKAPAFEGVSFFSFCFPYIYQGFPLPLVSSIQPIPNRKPCLYLTNFGRRGRRPDLLDTLFFLWIYERMIRMTRGGYIWIGTSTFLLRGGEGREKGRKIKNFEYGSPSTRRDLKE